MSEPATLTSIEAYLKMRMEEYIMNAGDTAFILLCAAFVFIMTPGLAFSMEEWYEEKTLETR